MLAMNTYDQTYIDECRAKISSQVAVYRRLADTVADLPADGGQAKADAAVHELEKVFFNNLVLVLENYFVHRTRALEKKDGNPLNEVRVLCSSMTSNDGVMLAEKSIKMNPEKSVLGYRVGDAIELDEESFARLSAAFFAEIEKKFSATAG